MISLTAHQFDIQRVTALLLSLIISAVGAHHRHAAAADETDQPDKRVARAPYRTLFVTRSLAHEKLIPYLEAARPEIVQIGNYGAMFHGYADNPRSTKSPMMLPVAGERAALKFQQKLNSKVHAMGLKVVGHFRLIKVMADWKEQSGFVEYYNKRWPEDLLGPKPHPQLSELLQRDADGNPVQVSRYDKGQLTLCLSSPYARKMLKQMLKCAVDHGVDGVMTNYNYRYDCACPHCQTAFKDWLAKHHTPAEIKSKLDIADLSKHTFRSIPARIPGYPNPQEATELDWLAVRWGAEHFKRMFDEIFVEYGRSLKKNLLIAQWNHLSHVSLKEERMFVPLELWGRGEDYFWYSGGASFVGKRLNLKEGRAGDAWLSCLYVREMSGNKPFLMGKYDRIRLAASMAEGYATGGLGMGRYMRFEDPVGFEVLTRYTNFMHEHRALYDGAEIWADAALVLPRQTILSRQPEALDSFRDLGQALVERQVLLDVLLDQKITPERLSQYPAIILPQTVVLDDEQLAALRSYAEKGGKVLRRGETGTRTLSNAPRQNADIRQAVEVTGDTPKTAADFIVKQLVEEGATRIDSPWTIRATAYRQPEQALLHLVNYNRNEEVDKTLSGPASERPISEKNVRVRFRIPAGSRATAVTLHSPDKQNSSQLKFNTQAGHVSFTVPEIKVYAVISVQLSGE